MRNAGLRRTSLLLLVFASIAGVAQAELTRGIQIVAEDSASKEWVDIPLYGKTYAVVIGIDQYPALKPDQQLTYAVSDAKAVEVLLRNKFVFDEVFTLYNEQATRSNILDLLLNRLAKIGNDDAVFVFFAGHGGQEQTNYGPIGFLVPHDGSFGDMRKVISMTSIRDDISKRINAKHVFYVMDACYSGLLASTRGEERTTRRDVAYLQQIAKESVRQVLTAGSADQQVLDGGPGGHSVFTGRLLEILDGANDFITATEVSALVKERVFSDANARGHVQTPKSGELFGLGDFIFMPSVTKKLGSIQDQISGLEQEFKQLKEAEAKAVHMQDENARREAVRLASVAEAKLQAKKLEEERLRQEKIAREERDRQRREQQEALRLQQEAETARLETLQREVVEKRKQYKSSMVTSLEGALAELQALDKEILGIRGRYREELKGRILAIAKAHSDSFGDVALKKDEFETEAEYQARIAKSAAGGGGDNKAKYQQAMDVVRGEYEVQVAPLKAQMEEITRGEYTIYGHDGLKLALGRYDADRECFTVTVASANIDRPIYPYQHFLFVTEANRYEQAAKAGIRSGDLILRYNGRDVTPTSDWSKLRQTVLAATTTMEVDRGGNLVPIQVAKGKVGIETRPDDYLPELKQDQFVANGLLYIPRAEARQFKQDFVNKLVTAEVTVSAKSPSLCLVKAAFVVDEASGRRYDLFKSEYVSMGNRITWDTKREVYWVGKSLHKLGYAGAVRFLQRLEYRGTTGWVLPTLADGEGIREPAAVWKYGFHDNWFYTRTPHPKNRGNWGRYKPSEGKTDWGSTSEVGVIATASELDLPNYDVFFDRYIELGSHLVFDVITRVLWVMQQSPNRLTYLEAETYVKQLVLDGKRGWRLPELSELEALWDLAVPGIDRRYIKVLNDWFYTRTPHLKNKGNWGRYKPSEGRTDWGSTSEVPVIAVM